MLVLAGRKSCRSASSSRSASSARLSTGRGLRCSTCTSAMAEDVACEALRIFRERGIAHVSVSQSEALDQFHTQKLRLGEPSADGWTLAPIDSEAVEEQAQGDDGS